MAETQTIEDVYAKKRAELRSFFTKLIETAKDGPIKARIQGLNEFVEETYRSLDYNFQVAEELRDDTDKLEAENKSLKKENKTLRSSLEDKVQTEIQEETTEETSLDRLRTERRRIRNRYESSQAQIKTLTEVLAGTKKELSGLRRITTRDVDGLKKVLKDHFNYKEKDFEAYKSRGELFQYLVSRIELEVATLRLKYEKETQE